MRRAASAPRLGPLLALVALAVAGCVTADGASVDSCDASWTTLDPQIVQPGGVDEGAVEIECMREVYARRLRIGFFLPAGPDCHRLSRIDVVETADAVSITLFLARSDDPAAGACPPEPQRVRTELDLRQPVGDRALLDGSREPRSSPSP